MDSPSVRRAPFPIAVLFSEAFRACLGRKGHRCWRHRLHGFPEKAHEFARKGHDGFRGRFTLNQAAVSFV